MSASCEPSGSMIIVDANMTIHVNPPETLRSHGNRVWKRKPGVPSRQEVYEALKERSRQLQQMMNGEP